ncbi:MAG: imelysin family protein [Gammaproteobacteria bacterium]|nr:imelysin family protein [Gammaproteobacteria bacterium]
MFVNKVWLVLIALTATIFSQPLLAELPGEADWHRFNQAVMGEHVLPRYAELTGKSQLMATAVGDFCRQADEKSLAEARQATIEAILAWQGIQHIQFGPVTFLMRNFDLQYWPDRKGIGARQLRQVLQQKDAVFDDKFFRDASASIKGFPALESLLFRKDMLEKATGEFNHCPLATGIAVTIAATTKAIEKEWSETRAAIESAGDESEDYEMAADASTQFLKALVEPIEVIRDVKLKTPLGDSLEDLRWKRSEFWRSGQSVNSIRANIQSLRDLYSGQEQTGVDSLLRKAGEEQLATDIQQAFEAIEGQLTNAREPEQGNMSAEQYQNLQAVRTSLGQLQDELEKAMDSLDIHLGFNSRDGD